MEEFRSVSVKRKIDQVENEDPNPPNKKIKISNIASEKERVLFSHLPPEVPHHVLSFITNDAHRRHVRLVCHSWFDFINYNEFKIGVLLGSEVEEFYRCFSRYERPIGLKFMKLDYLNDNEMNANLMTAKQIKKTIKHLTGLTSLDLRLPNFEVPKEFINLRALTIINAIRETFTNLIHLTRLKTRKISSNQTAKFHPNLAKLEFDGYSLQTKFPEPSTRLTNLKISSVNGDLVSALPNLRKLEIRSLGPIFTPLSSSMNLLPNLEKLVTNVEVPALYGTNLTYLQLLIFNLESPVEITPKLSNLRKLMCDKVRIPQNDQSALSSLESCCIYNTSSNETILGHLNSQKITQLKTTITEKNYLQLSRFTKLVDLHLTIKTLIGPDSYLLPIYSLTKLFMAYNNYYPCQWLSTLPNLVDLSIGKLDSINSIPEELDFASFKYLTALRLHGNYFRINVQGLTNLAVLNSENRSARTLKDRLEIYGLSTLTNLTSLMFGYTVQKYPALKNWDELSHLTKLRELCILKANDSEEVMMLTTLQHLTYLDIACGSNSLQYLTKLSRLQKVEVISDAPAKVRSILAKLPFCYYFSK